MSSQWDVAGRRTRLTWPDGFYVVYDHDVPGHVTAIRETGATSGAGVLALYAWDSRGRLAGIARGNGVLTSYGYDAISRVTGMLHDPSGTGQDALWGYGYNPASQVVSETRDNDAWAWTQHWNHDDAYTINGLNQATAVAGSSLSYDSNGNLTSDGVKSYGYDASNQLRSGTGSAALTYDPAGRLLDTSLSSTLTARLGYDGAQAATDYSGAGAVLHRYVPGLTLDQPVAFYEGPGPVSGTTTRTWPLQDRLGSMIAVTDASGAATAINAYDEYGVPNSANSGRFGFTGQTWVPELGSPNYRARQYGQDLGRFMQTDPIGMDDGLNIYDYVRNDPINSYDPFGLGCTNLPGERFPQGGECDNGEPTNFEEIVITARRCRQGWLCFRDFLGIEIFNFSIPTFGLTIGGVGNPHHYEVNVDTVCSASDAAESMRAPLMSAPGAGYVGTGENRVVLWLGNPIVQGLSDDGRSITNTTTREHAFYPGTVNILTTERPFNTSNIHIVGQGNSSSVGLQITNQIVGGLYFGITPRAVAASCAHASAARYGALGM